MTIFLYIASFIVGLCFGYYLGFKFGIKFLYDKFINEFGDTKNE